MRQASALFLLLLVFPLASASKSLSIQSMDRQVQFGEGRTDEVESWGECIEGNARRLGRRGGLPPQIWISVEKLRVICQEGMFIRNKLGSCWNTYLQNANQTQGSFAIQLMEQFLYQLWRSIQSLLIQYHLEKNKLNRAPNRSRKGISGKVLAQVYSKIEEQNSLALTLWQKISQRVQQKKGAIRSNSLLLRDTKYNAKIQISESFNDEGKIEKYGEISMRTTQASSAVQKGNLQTDSRRDRMSLMRQGGFGRLLIRGRIQTDQKAKLAPVGLHPFNRRDPFRGKALKIKNSPIVVHAKAGTSNATLRSILKKPQDHEDNHWPKPKHVSFLDQSNSSLSRRMARLTFV